MAYVIWSKVEFEGIQSVDILWNLKYLISTHQKKQTNIKLGKTFSNQFFFSSQFQNITYSLFAKLCYYPNMMCHTVGFVLEKFSGDFPFLILCKFVKISRKIYYVGYKKKKLTQISLKTMLFSTLYMSSFQKIRQNILPPALWPLLIPLGEFLVGLFIKYRNYWPNIILIASAIPARWFFYFYPFQSLWIEFWKILT